MRDRAENEQSSTPQQEGRTMTDRRILNMNAKDKLIDILVGEIHSDCDTCHVKEECPHDDTCKPRLLEFYKKIAEQETR